MGVPTASDHQKTTCALYPAAKTGAFVRVSALKFRFYFTVSAGSAGADVPAAGGSGGRGGSRAAPREAAPRGASRSWLRVGVELRCCCKSGPKEQSLLPSPRGRDRGAPGWPGWPSTRTCGTHRRRPRHGPPASERFGREGGRRPLPPSSHRSSMPERPRSAPRWCPLLRNSAGSRRRLGGWVVLRRISASTLTPRSAGSSGGGAAPSGPPSLEFVRSLEERSLPKKLKSVARKNAETGVRIRFCATKPREHEPIKAEANGGRLAPSSSCPTSPTRFFRSARISRSDEPRGELPVGGGRN
jgi:hypothetical protein